MLLVSCVHPTWNMVNHTCIMCVSHVKHGASHVYHVCIPRVSCVYLTWIMVHHTCIMCASHVYHVCIPRETWCITRESCVYPTWIMVHHTWIVVHDTCVTHTSYMYIIHVHIHHASMLLCDAAMWCCKMLRCDAVRCCKVNNTHMLLTDVANDMLFFLQLFLQLHLHTWSTISCSSGEMFDEISYTS